MSKLSIRCQAAFTVAALLSALSPTWAQNPAATAPSQPAAPQIEVCFVLDTTGSMGGLIAGAKAKIWSIANQMIAAKPTPRLKIGLLGYRDRGDEYVTKAFPLTEDIDAVYANLQQFQAAAGGDEPESVNQALHEAVTKMEWSTEPSVLKIIFLVGDSPPHMDYADDVKYTDVCQLAMQKDLIINTVQCGSTASTTPIWEEIARRAEGSFVAIGQTGDMQVVSTPMDKELAELNVAVGATIVPYGSAARQHDVLAKQKVSEAAGAPVAAERLAFAAGVGRGAPGGGDLVDDVKAGRTRLADVKTDDLPPPMQKRNADAQTAYLKDQAEKRAGLQTRVNALLKQRQAFVDAELRKLAESGKGNAFDVQVGRLIREQAQRKGIHYAAPATTQPETSPGQVVQP